MRGLRHFSAAAAGAAVSRYQLEAGIAAFHCSAKTFAETDWTGINGLYDRLPVPISTLRLPFVDRRRNGVFWAKNVGNASLRASSEPKL